MKIIVKDFNIISENERLVPGRGRLILNSKYRKCKNDLILLMRSQLPDNYKSIDSNLPITVAVHTYKDIDNVQKIIFDSMQLAGVIDNDRLIEDIRIVKFPVKRGKPDRIEIFIEEKINHR